jgi:beta-phosphoglucomutase-like phosphatase (HAD superfamily)
VRIRALVFDFDDTIVDSEPTNTELLREFLRSEFAITLSPEEEESTFYYSWKDTFPMLCRRFGIPLGYQEMWERFMAVKRRWLAGNTLRVAQGAGPLLSVPLPKAIVSGSMREEIRAMLDNIGMAEDTFAVTVSAEDVTRCKPDPEGFIRALALLGVSSPEALVFEDSPIGIAAARRCGIPVAFVREFAWRDTCAEANLCFDTLEDALPWVQERIR